MQRPLDYVRERFSQYLTDEDIDAEAALMRAYQHGDPDKRVLTRMGGSEPARFLISEDHAKAWAPIAVPARGKGKIEIVPTSTRRRRDWIVDVIMSPPKTPFLAVGLGMSGNDMAHWRFTLSPEMIVFAGASSLLDGENVVQVDRRRFVDGVAWFKRTGTPVSDLLRRREIERRFKRGWVSGERTRAQLAAIKTPADLLASYNGPTDGFQMRLAYFAASEWEPVPA